MRYTGKFDSPNVIPAYEVEQRIGRKIEACPFCGGLALGVFAMVSAHVSCAGCGADGPLVRENESQPGHWYSITIAVERWNSRGKPYEGRGRPGKA